MDFTVFWRRSAKPSETAALPGPVTYRNPEPLPPMAAWPSAGVAEVIAAGEYWKRVFAEAGV